MFFRCALRFWRMALVLLFAGLNAMPVLAADPVLINVDVGNPPFMYKTDREESAQGIYPILLKAIFERLDVPVKIRAVPWKRALQSIDHGVAGIGGIYVNEERLRKYDYSDPLFVERIAVYYNKNRPIDYTSVEDLVGKRVGVMLGWSYGDEFDLAGKRGQIFVEAVNLPQQNFEKLLRGRVDAVLAPVESGDLFLADSQYQDIVMAKTLLHANTAHLAFLKKANQMVLIERFNKELVKMKKDGSLDKIVQQELSR